jgi:hypothetical protein
MRYCEGITLCTAVEFYWALLQTQPSSFEFPWPQTSFSASDVQVVTLEQALDRGKLNKLIDAGLKRWVVIGGAEHALKLVKGL